MLRHLRVCDLALIQSLDMEFSAGMSVLTGETGAGKSLLLDALGLLAGARATPSLVRNGADRGVVEALFEVPATGGALTALLTEWGLESEEPGEVILRRELAANGRSRATINGRMVPLSQLAEVAAHLLEINGQHDQQQLLDPARQRDLYDDFAGLSAHRQRVLRAWEELTAAERELEALEGDARDRAQRADFLRYQVEELEGLGMQAGEHERLEAEVRRLASTEELTALGGQVTAALSEGADGESCVLDLLGRAAGALRTMVGRDESLRGALESLEEAQARLTDAAYELSRYIGRLEADPGQLDELQARCEALKRALRKHGPTEEEAIARLEAMRAELATLDNWDAAREDAEKQVAAARHALSAAAAELSAARAKAAPRFLKPLVALLRDFAMPKVRVEVRFAPVSGGRALDDAGTLCSATGAEDVELWFCANEGEELQPLRRVASGGELSRVMLALRTMEAEKSAVPMLVFDEVDAGISGAAARSVADRLAALGERCQILCVTHSAAVAAAAGTHFVVTKREKSGRTTSSIDRVEGLRRQEELARLLDSGRGSARSLALAAEMLEQAG